MAAKEEEIRFFKTQLAMQTLCIQNMRNSIDINLQLNRSSLVEDEEEDADLYFAEEEGGEDEEEEGDTGEADSDRRNGSARTRVPAVERQRSDGSLGASIKGILLPLADDDAAEAATHTPSPAPPVEHKQPATSSSSSSSSSSSGVSGVSAKNKMTKSQLFTLPPQERLRVLTTNCVKLLGKKVFIQGE